MNRYISTIQRAAFGIAAIALSALTFALSVVLPAHLATDRHDARSLAASKAVVPAALEVAIIPARIHVVGECEQTTADDRARALPNADQPS